jgi:hypothetical protein
MAKAGTELLQKSSRRGRMLKKEMATVVRGYCGSSEWQSGLDSSNLYRGKHDLAALSITAAPPP